MMLVLVLVLLLSSSPLLAAAGIAAIPPFVLRLLCIPFQFDGSAVTVRLGAAGFDAQAA